MRLHYATHANCFVTVWEAQQNGEHLELVLTHVMVL